MTRVMTGKGILAADADIAELQTLLDAVAPANNRD
jgi:hypothetical protein